MPIHCAFPSMIQRQSNIGTGRPLPGGNLIPNSCALTVGRDGGMADNNDPYTMVMIVPVDSGMEMEFSWASWPASESWSRAC
ncbi:hypothetical protein P3T37_001618 [Kitasatospora sp. MAA4]|nr:hypothetical protein [Kitasatospora sp. MAA4]